MVLHGTDKPTEDKSLCHRKLIFDILQVILTFSFSSTCMSELGYLKMRTEKKNVQTITRHEKDEN